MRILTALFLLIAAPVGAQTHCDVHYRWQEKTDTTHIADTVASTSVSQVLNWSSPAFTGGISITMQFVTGLVFRGGDVLVPGEESPRAETRSVLRTCRLVRISSPLSRTLVPRSMAVET